MTYSSLREWIVGLEKAGRLKRIKAKVDWDLEANAIARRVENDQGPALLFENIKDHENTLCRKLFLNSLGIRERVAMALGLPPQTFDRGIVEDLKGKLGNRLNTIKVSSGPVKQNIVTGKAVNLYEFPVPKYMELDGGRYINTRACLVTMDPDTKLMNVGLYRGMIGDNEKSIPVLLARNQHWGVHFPKYEQRRVEMPVAVVYGCDPVLFLCATAPLIHPGCSEYEVAGGISGKPIELVKCELSDLYVPASAEIVLEGWISPDPSNFQWEGPFGGVSRFLYWFALAGAHYSC